MTYNELQKKHKEGFQSFEMFFAYSNRQLEEGLTALGLKKDDLDRIIKYGLYNIIKNRNLIIEAHSNIHFIKPQKTKKAHQPIRFL